MGLFDVTQAALDRALEGAAQRQQLLASNLANADTPGFKRSDLDFHGALAAALDQGDSAAQVAALPFAPQTDSAGAITPDGNNVDVDVEMANLSANAIDYETLVEVAHARLQMLSSAIGSTGS